MKAPTILLFCLLVLNTQAQNKFVGHYHDFFAGSFVVNSDSTFKYEFHFDLESSWTKGTWTTSNDTIYFQMIPILDTLKYVDANGVSRDSLRLSLDETPGQVTLEETQLLYSGGQERHPCPKKLYFKHNTIFRQMGSCSLKSLLGATGNLHRGSLKNKPTHNTRFAASLQRAGFAHKIK